MTTAIDELLAEWIDYLSMPSERFVRRDFEVTRASSDEAIAAEAHRHPVFALTPAP